MANGRGADPYVDDDDHEIGPQPWPDPEPLVEPAEEEQPYPLDACHRSSAMRLLNISNTASSRHR